ncbi:sugar transferase [Streptantibioticus ferralitis]|uniref:Sugar transferase n=1 Tax=Streptantibioticus ferralitis TaxID=236510 RepID=A0ABT5Z111_9ACTN|nr:sugar transferase [Streptantibioticus ferralitis]MDF2257448.1 sugar transferase [Streptantibioticus ferralitis]
MSGNRSSCAVVLEGGIWREADDDCLDDELTVVARLPVPVDLAQLDAVLTAHRPRLLLVKSSLEYLDTRLLNLSLVHRAEVYVLARPAYGLLGSVRLRRLGGLPWLRLRVPTHDRVGARAMRVTELLLIVLSTPFVLPLMLLICLVLCWDGHPFYFQNRVGEGGRIIRLVKFRTMRPDAERDSGPVLAEANDPRVTPVGHLLRRTRLDELPQLWNVLRGDMSLVGPRPERPEFVREFRRLPYYDLRHLIRPGLTGIAQLTDGYRSTVQKKIRCDLLYVNCRSLHLDFHLLMLTLRDLVRGFPRG